MALVAKAIHNLKSVKKPIKFIKPEDLSTCDEILIDQVNSESLLKYDSYLQINYAMKKYNIHCLKCNVGEMCKPIHCCILLYDAYLFYEIIRTINILSNFDVKVTKYSINQLYNHTKQIPNTIRFIIMPNQSTVSFIDFVGYARVCKLLHRKILTDETMAWLSTLGGGFSSLGDHFSDAAYLAGAISARQMHLATECGNPLIQAKCRLWFAQSLMQQGRLKESKQIIQQIYALQKKMFTEEDRINLMCLGLWQRLKFYWKASKTGYTPKRLYEDVERIMGSI